MGCNLCTLQKREEHYKLLYEIAQVSGSDPDIAVVLYASVLPAESTSAAAAAAACFQALRRSQLCFSEMNENV